VVSIKRGEALGERGRGVELWNISPRVVMGVVTGLLEGVEGGGTVGSG